MPHIIINDVVEDLRLYGGKPEALADALDLTPANREWLRQRITESMEDTHGRALAESRIMIERGFSKTMRLSILANRYYGGNGYDRIDQRGYGQLARVVVSDVPPAVKGKADLHEAWIREDPERLAKYLASLPQI